MTNVAVQIPEVHLSVFEGDFIDDAREQITYLLQLAGVGTDDLLFSGHASSDLSDKEGDEFCDFDPPKEVSDGALPIFFGDFGNLGSSNIFNNPLYYAHRAWDEDGDTPRVDVYSAAAIKRLAEQVTYDTNLVWLTPEQVRGVTIGTFVLGVQE